MLFEQRKHRMLGVGAAAIIVSLMTSACQEVQSSSANEAGKAASKESSVNAIPIGDRKVVQGGNLVIGLSAEPDVLDPTLSSSLHMEHLAEPICEKLYDIDGDGGVFPVLATALPEISADGLTATIRVRTDAVFSDGTAMDASAVATSLKRHFEETGSKRRSEMGPLATVAVSDAETVQLTYSEPFSPLATILADRAGMIMSPTRLAELGKNFGDNPSCVGPYRFVSRTQNAISYEADPNYYSPQDVHLDTIEYRFISDPSIRAANLRSGDIHIADTLSPLDMDDLIKDDSMQIIQSSVYGYQGISVNLADDTPLARNPDLRRALTMGIDRQAIADSVFEGWYDPACSPIAPETPFSTDASDACPDYDPDTARELLEKSGVELPYPVTLNVRNDADSLRLAQAYQAQLKEIGFDLTINPLENTAFLQTLFESDFELIASGWSGKADPHGNMYNFLHTGAGNNYAGYSSPQVDELLNEASREVEPTARAELYGQVIGKVQDDNPLIYMYRLRSLTGVTSNVAGVEQYGNVVLRVSNAAFIED